MYSRKVLLKVCISKLVIWSYRYEQLPTVLVYHARAGLAVQNTGSLSNAIQVQLCLDEVLKGGLFSLLIKEKANQKEGNVSLAKTHDTQTETFPVNK